MSYQHLKTLFVSITVLLLIACVKQPDIVIPETVPPVATLKKAPRVALVLGSGGARGYAHVGVISELSQAGIPIDLIVGASSGSLIGALYADQADVAQLQEIMLNTGFMDFVDLSPLSRGGFISGSQVQRFVLNNMDNEHFEQLAIKLVTVATDLRTGKAITLESGPIAPAVNASVALPGLLKPVKLYGYVLVDGGVAAPLPVQIAQTYAPVLIIAVTLKKPLPETLPRNSYQIYSRAHDILWLHLLEKSEQGADIIIHPEIIHQGTFSISKQYDTFEAGQQAAKEAMPEILRLLKENNIELITDVVIPDKVA